MNNNNTCPEAEALIGLLDEQLPRLQQDETTEHVNSCETCQQSLESLVTYGLREDLDFENVGEYLRQGIAEEHTLSHDARQRLTSVLSGQSTTSSYHLTPGLSLDFLEPTEQEDSLGRLGQFEVTEVIGRGGMGVVLKARDTRLDRVVAIKVLAPELAANPTARKRFLREAQSAAAVSHDHVVTTFAVEPGDLPYLAMEYIDGQSLQQKIDRDGPLKTREILRIGMQTAYGLAAAHAQGLIHRDIKPSNILLQNSVERVQITDFGLARAVDDVAITRTGEINGTPQYMSPEQAQGLPSDHRSDMFSLGCVMYAMCTGRSPFRADSTMAVLHRVCNDAPRPISEVNTDIPVWMSGIIDRLLAKDPADRLQSAAEVADLLSQCLAHVQQPTVVPKPEVLPVTNRIKSHISRRPKWHVGAILLAVLFGSLGLTEATGVTKFSASVISIVRGDGTLVVEVSDPRVSLTIEGEDIVITGAGPKEVRLKPGEYRLQAKKDGRSVPLERELVNIVRGGRQVVKVKLRQNSAPYELSSGRALSEVRRFHGHTGPVRDVAFSADGQLCLSGGFDQTLRLWNVATGESLKAFRVGEYIDTVALSPAGRLAACGSASVGKVVLWNLKTDEPIKEFSGQAGGIKRLTFSPDGQLLASRANDTIRLWNVETGALQKEIATPIYGYAFEFSPDGRSFVFAIGNVISLCETASGAQIWSTTLPEGVNCLHIMFSPDGQFIANSARYSFEIRNVADGSLKGRFVGHQDGQRIPAHFKFTADSVHLISISLSNEMIIWSIDTLSATHRVQLGNTYPHHLAVTPDGRAAITCGGALWRGPGNGWTLGDDSDLHLWQLPESVWPQKPADPKDATEENGTVSDPTLQESPHESESPK